MKSLALAASITVAACTTLPAFAQHDAHAHHTQGAAPEQETDAHAHHGYPAPADASQKLPTPSPFPTPTAAERAAAFPPELEGMDMRTHMDDNPLVAVFRGDRLEYGEDDALGWDLRAGIGRNFDKLWLRSEGERGDDGLEHASTEVFWSHATGPWWDRTIGLRHDTGGAATRDWAAIGVQGLAPYKFEVEATGYVGTSGRLAARVEAEYEVLLTNRLILQPKLEANFYSRDDDENRIGKGLSDASFGLRLRYEFSRRFAPYVGHVWTRRFGGTADRFEAAGGDASEHAWVAGVRFWF
jgi:copper resistance protein B